MTRLILICALGAALMLGACKGNKEPAGDPPADPPPAVAADPGPGAGGDVDEAKLDELDVATTPEPETKVEEDQLATPEDFEDEAEKKITVANMESELDALEDELGEE